MSINPYLFYDGKCEEAFKFYEKALGGKIQAMLTYEGAPESMPTPPDWNKKIMHAMMTIDGQTTDGLGCVSRSFSQASRLRRLAAAR